MRVFVLSFIACLIVSTAQAKYSGGTGEPNDPYQIATAADLIALGETPEDYDKHFILTADIPCRPSRPAVRGWTVQLGDGAGTVSTGVSVSVTRTKSRPRSRGRWP